MPFGYFDCIRFTFNMKNPRFLSVALVLISQILAAEATPIEEKKVLPPFFRESARIETSGYRSAERSEAYRRIYAAYYSDDIDDAAPKKMTSAEMVQRFKAALTVFFYTFDEKYVPVMLKSLERLESNGLAKPYDYKQMYRSLLVAREFDRARLFAKEKGLTDMDPLPEVHPLTHHSFDRSVWTISNSGPLLEQEKYEMPDGPVVILLANPNCHFSQDALHDLSLDARLTSRMHSVLKLLSPPDPNFNFEDYQQWNRANPSFSMVLMNKVGEWPMFSDWSTPIFYFFRDKHLISIVEGWPKKGRKAEIERALDSIGVE